MRNVPRKAPYCALVISSIIFFPSLPGILTVQAATLTEQSFVVPGISHRGGAGGPLQRPSHAGKPATVAEFLTAQGWAQATIASLRARTTMALSKGGSVLVLEQEVDGLAVYGARLKAAFDSSGNLLSIDGSMAPVGRAVLSPQIDKRAALDAALAAVHPGLGVTLSETARMGNTTTFGGDAAFYSDPTVTRVAYPGRGAVLEEGFLVELWVNEGNRLDYVLVGGDGTVLHVENRTANDSYLIFPESPGADPVQQVVNGPAPGTTVESPDGWLTTSGTLWQVHIHGNNTNTYLDSDNNGFSDPEPPASVVSAPYDFDSVMVDTIDPRDGDNRAVAIQNLFYLNNLIHDDLYRYGFTEAAGNFQLNNFGRGGAANDQVRAEAQDGGGLNNANISVPGDGTSPRMQMYLWDFTSPRRDGSLDADIVWHEYGHGLTWRIIGGMSGAMGAAVGEGASDSVAIITHNDPIMSAWPVDDPGGIRSAPYDTYDTTGRTYESITGASVHNDGEIYAAIMWDMWARYRDDASGAVSGNLSTRRDIIMTDIVDGMKLTGQQCNQTTFPKMRDGMLQAISGMPNPQSAPTDPSDLGRWCHAWKAFAKYGVGTDSTTTCQDLVVTVSWEWYNGFQVPPECGGEVPNVVPTVAITAPADGSSHDLGSAVTFAGTADDSEDGDLSAYLSWTSNIDGPIGSGAGFTTSTLSAGSHTITAAVTDSAGSGSSSEIAISVTPVASNVPPTASYSFDCSDLACSFTDTSTDGDGTIAAWAWDFGDSSTSSLTNPGHSYAAAGTYTVSLTVTDNNGASANSSQSVTVTTPAPSAPPTASFTYSCSEFACSFTDSSTDSDGTIAGWAWDFGDGYGSLAQHPNYVYASAGTYTVTLTVTDDLGNAGSSSQAVTITGAAPNAPPTADFTFACAGLGCDFTDGSTDSDGAVVGRAWNFGDLSTSTLAGPHHSYAVSGTYPVTLTVTDDNGVSSSVSKSVTVTANAPPTASFTYGCTDLSCSFADASTDSDGSIVAWSWDFGDGYGSVAQNPSYSYAAAGTYTVTLTVTDDDGGSDTMSLSVTVASVGEPVIHVGDLDGTGVNITGGQWQATVTVTIHGGDESPVSGATINGLWSGGASGSSTCDTIVDGTCTITSAAQKMSEGTVIFTVTDVIGSSYVAADNHDADGDSNGTAISVSKP